MTDDAYETWRKYIYDNTGIYFQDNKKYLLESRLQKRINFLKLKSFEEYFNLIKFKGNLNDELKYLYEVITINETFFFRNQPQFDALISKILPEVIKTKSSIDKKIRIWSAASSSGEEAYTIALMFNDLIKPKFPGIELEVVGTDINHAVIKTARRGIYKDYSIRNTSPYFLKKYFAKTAAGYEIDPKIKSMVKFKELNLNNSIAMRSMNNFDVIFCANVLIYFDKQSKMRTVQHLYNSLKPNGYLFIGYAETLHGISKAFKIVSFPKTIGYKKG
ncbi:MAG: protein-glutamate O-methyltransferase CheR [Ignavibacteriae bacterium]|nr:protein-glutamate O-methyltransferase CheR [Ignavibacteriota bacterium]NOG97123.1 protein-glutamate O-methyltransferase CheR [Ignavibacteriota bacterium]